MMTHTIAFNRGWTWVSSPLFETSGSITLTDVLDDMGGMASSTDDLIKDQTQFTSYIPGYGWFGQLATLSPTNMYKVRLQIAGEWSISGTPPDLNGREVGLNAGWTWLGWPVMTPGVIADTFVPALDNSQLVNSEDDRIKNQYGFTSWIPGYGWFGELTTFEPGNGYQIKMVHANTLRNFGIVGVERRRQRKLEAVPTPPRVVSSGEWRVAPATFESSMCLVVAVIIDGAVDEDGDLAAFVNTELRGVARSSSYVAPFGSYKGFKTYNLMAYGQADTEGATITFQYRHADGRLTRLNQTTTFQRDGFMGSVVKPFVVEATTATKKPIATLVTPIPTGATISAIESIATPTDAIKERTVDINPTFLAALAASSLALILLTIAVCIRRARAPATFNPEAEVEPSTSVKLPA